MYNTPTL